MSWIDFSVEHRAVLDRSLHPYISYHRVYNEARVEIRLPTSDYTTIFKLSSSKLSWCDPAGDESTERTLG